MKIWRVEFCQATSKGQPALDTWGFSVTRFDYTGA